MEEILSMFVKLGFLIVQRYRERQHFGFLVAEKKKYFPVFLHPVMLSRINVVSRF